MQLESLQPESADITLCDSPFANSVWWWRLRSFICRPVRSGFSPDYRTLIA